MDEKRLQQRVPTKPMQPCMTYEEIRVALQPRRNHALHISSGISPYEPADGVDTSARRALYKKECLTYARSRMWYKLHKRKIRKINVIDFPPALLPTAATEQTINFRANYVRCRLHGFCTNPWNKGGIDEYFENKPACRKGEPKPREGVRVAWTFERGFQKLYRTDPKWTNLDFDEPELSPEETAPNEVAKEWMASYMERSPLKPSRVDSHHSAPSSISASSRAASTIFSSDLNAQPESKRRSLALKLQKVTHKLGRVVHSPHSPGDEDEQLLTSPSSSNSSGSGELALYSGIVTPHLRRAVTTGCENHYPGRSSTSHLPHRELPAQVSPLQKPSASMMF